MPNPQQPELARARKSDAVSDDALPTKATKRSKKQATTDAPGPVPAASRPGHAPDVVPDKPMIPPDAFRVHDAEEVRGPDAAGERVRFPFRFEPLLVPFAVAVGVTPRTAWVELDDDTLTVRFGPWSLSTSRDNIAGCEVTGPYAMVKVAGPPRLSFRDLGVTFATNRRAGACIRFHESVPALLPSGLLRHRAATVTVTDPHELARRLGGGG